MQDLDAAALEAWLARVPATSRVSSDRQAAGSTEDRLKCLLDSEALCLLGLAQLVHQDLERIRAAVISSGSGSQAGPQAAALMADMVSWPGCAGCMIACGAACEYTASASCRQAELVTAADMHAGAAQVPEQWQLAAPPGFPQGPVSAWLDALAAAWDFLAAWRSSGPPAVACLGGLYCPAGYLLGLQQSFAQANGLPTDLVQLDVQVRKSRTAWHCSCKPMHPGLLCLASSTPRDQVSYLSACAQVHLAGAAPGPSQARMTGLWLHGAGCSGPTASLAPPAHQHYAPSRIDLLVQPTRRRLASQDQDGKDGALQSGAQEQGFLCPVYCQSRRGQGIAAKEHLMDICIQLPPGCEQDSLRLHGVSLAFNS